MSKLYKAKKDGYDCVVASWYKQQTKDAHFDIIKEYETLESFMQDITDDFTDEFYMSDGECLDLAIELYDHGIAYL